MDPYLAWGLGLLALALLLVLLEFFVPSAGAIAISAGVCTIAGLVCLFRFSPLWGLMGLVGMIVAVPLTVYAGMSLWQHTPLGRRMIGIPTEQQLEEKAREQERFLQQRLSLLGREGVTLTDLRPIGVIEIDGQRHDAVSEGELIRPNARVKVVLVESTQLRVRVIT